MNMNWQITHKWQWKYLHQSAIIFQEMGLFLQPFRRYMTKYGKKKLVGILKREELRKWTSEELKELLTDDTFRVNAFLALAMPGHRPVNADGTLMTNHSRDYLWAFLDFDRYEPLEQSLEQVRKTIGEPAIIGESARGGLFGFVRGVDAGQDGPLLNIDGIGIDLVGGVKVNRYKNKQNTGDPAKGIFIPGSYHPALGTNTRLVSINGKYDMNCVVTWQKLYDLALEVDPKAVIMNKPNNPITTKKLSYTTPVLAENVMLKPMTHPRQDWALKQSYKCFTTKRYDLLVDMKNQLHESGWESHRWNSLITDTAKNFGVPIAQEWIV